MEVVSHLKMDFGTFGTSFTKFGTSLKIFDTSLKNFGIQSLSYRDPYLITHGSFIPLEIFRK